MTDPAEVERVAKDLECIDADGAEDTLREAAALLRSQAYELTSLRAENERLRERVGELEGTLQDIKTLPSRWRKSVLLPSDFEGHECARVVAELVSECADQLELISDGDVDTEAGMPLPLREGTDQ